MTHAAVDQSQNAYARLAGFMYLFVDVAYLVGLFIVSRFQVAGSVVDTAQRIVASETLYRIGLSSLLVGALCTIFLAVGLYGTVQAIDPKLVAGSGVPRGGGDRLRGRERAQLRVPAIVRRPWAPECL